MSAAGTYTQLHQFNGADGNWPSIGSLVYDARTGKLYGATYYGGDSDFGTVYSINTDGSHEKVIHSFSGGAHDGAGGGGGLLLLNRKLYGTTFVGGSGPCNNGFFGTGCGTIYSLKPGGADFSILYSFQGTTADGEYPLNGGLIYDRNTAKLYGVAQAGGHELVGSVFSIDPDGSDLTTLYSMSTAAGDANSPQGALLKVKDKLYGLANGGECGGNAWGSIFWVKLDGSAHKVAHSFCGPPAADGSQPGGALINVDGTLYSATMSGGTGTCISNSGCGTVFSFKPKTGAETNMHSFHHDGVDGFYPGATGLTYNPGNKRLYGVTAWGGTGSGCGSIGGCGTIFSIKPDGSDQRVEYSFQGGADGQFPNQDLLLVDGTFYGTTLWGGVHQCSTAAHTCGTIFSYTP